MHEKTQQIFEFMIELEKLKSVLRKTKVVGEQRYENSAEHSWQVCMLAQLLAGESPFEIDITRVIEILLVHDIPEIYAGDQIVYSSHDRSRARSGYPDFWPAATAPIVLVPEPLAGI